MKAKQELLYELHAYEYCNTIGMPWRCDCLVDDKVRINDDVAL